MRAQVSLIPNESKKLIAKALADLSEVKTALKDGIVAMHPSSSTLFLAEEILGKTPETGVSRPVVALPLPVSAEDAMRAVLDQVLRRFIVLGRLTVRWPDGELTALARKM